MALRYCNGFDSPVPDHGFQSQYGGGVITAGRNGNGLKVTTAPANSRYDNGPTATSRLIFGFAVQLLLGSTLNGIDPGIFAVTGYISDIDDWNQYAHLNVRANDDGSLELRLHRVDGTILATAPVDTVHTDGVGWNYIEADISIDPAAGHAIIRVDGFEVINYTGNTQGSSINTLIENIYFGGARSSAGWVLIDDMYVCDDTGTVNNTFLGEIQVNAVLPNGNGTRSELFGSDGDAVDNYLLVDDPVLDTADYVESAAPGDGDTYAFTNLTGTRGVLGAQVIAYASKDDTGARSLHALARAGAAELTGGDWALTTTYADHTTPFDTAPDGTGWDVTKFNAAEFGVEVAS